MLRLHSHSSRPYPGRPARFASPSGGAPVVESFDLNEGLLERILSKENLETAWKRVKANHGAPGVDGIAIEQFPDHTRSLWAGIRESLLAGTYPPSPGRRGENPKHN